jgi:potassium efflux system protein
VLATYLILSPPTRGQGPQPGTGAQQQTASSVPGTKPGLPNTTPPSEADAASLRAQTLKQLKVLEAGPSDPALGSPPATAPGPRTAPTPGAPASSPSTTADKPWQQLLQDRLRWLDEYDKASKELKKAKNPERSPEEQALEAQNELSRLQAILDQAGRQPETLLPPSYRGLGAAGSAAISAEVKEALEAMTNAVKEGKSKLEALRTEVIKQEAAQSARRAERDRLFQEVAMLKARGAVEEGVPSAMTARAGRLAHERVINSEWESRVEALRLQVVEAQLALQTKLAGVRDLTLQVYRARIEVAEKTLALMQDRYRAAAESQERDLTAKAAREESRARQSEDPLERFRARRRAELLELEAQVIKNEQVLVTNPAPCLDEQRSLADRAGADYARIKALLDDGRVSRLDAIRLNNEFRRIGPERDRLLRNELAILELRMQYYEDLLTQVEIELLQDSPRDRFEHDLIRERLPASRWAQGEALLAEFERRDRELLVRRRAALEKLSDLTAQTLDQVGRRLAILDEEYGFIRTHIFWVRDQEPIGLTTLNQGVRELQRLVTALGRLVQETTRRKLWGRPSAEFLIAAVAVLGLPIGLVRLRRTLRGWIV